MQDGASLLHPHIMTAAQDLTILGDQASTNGNAALRGALSRLLYSSNKSGVLFHDDCRYTGWEDM